jgi:hypothetical protein
LPRYFLIKILTIVVEGISKATLDYKRRGSIKGIKIGITLHLTHLLFVDDVLLFGNGSSREAKIFKEILDLYYKAIGMEVNNQNPSISFNGIPKGQARFLHIFWPFSTVDFNNGFKYLGFLLKPNG